jgi:hypothetical protein
MEGPLMVSNRLMRTRAKGNEKEPSNSFSVRKWSRSLLLTTSFSQAMKVLWSVTGQPVGMISPRLRKRGSSPTPR